MGKANAKQRDGYSFNQIVKLPLILMELKTMKWKYRDYMDT